MADLYIDNNWVEGRGSPLFSRNPATNEVVWNGRSASSTDVDLAVKAAENAFMDWSLRPQEDREAVLQRFKLILEGQGEALAQAISLETGKPHWEALQELKAMIGKIDISIEAQAIRCPQRTFAVGHATSVTRHRPHGVAVVFGPFNFPGHLPNGHIIPALLAGNTIVFKPSEITPLCAEIMASFWEQAALPKGVFNMVQGARETGHHLATHPHINALLFTGSRNTGLWLSELFSRHPEKILALELGGNNPLVIGEIDDVDAAAKMTIQSAFITAGQRCTCARRLIVIESERNKEFIEKLVSLIPRISIGAFTDSPEPFMGPVISNAAATKLLEEQDELIRKGGKSLVKMELLKANSAFLSPGLIDVTDMNPRSDTEFFGPLLQLIRVKDLQIAVQEANNTEYGLVAGIFSQRREDYDYFLKHARAGVINWNMPSTGANSGAPFGGIGQSGNHRPSAFYAADYCSYPVASLEAKQLQPSQVNMIKD